MGRKIGPIHLNLDSLAKKMAAIIGSLMSQSKLQLLEETPTTTTSKLGSHNVGKRTRIE